MRRPHSLRIFARYARYLLWEFRWPLAVFSALVLAGGLVLKRTYDIRPLSYPEACYGVFQMIFMESGLDFPHEWYLQPFFFLLPLVGLGAVADSVVRLAYLVFTQKQKLPEWHAMVASLYRDHVVVVGAGKVGNQIIKGLLELGEAVVAVEIQPESPLLDEVVDLGVPVIRGDGRNPRTLAQAGVAAARAVILATDDDLANLDGGLTARDLNPAARIVLRLFDETLAAKVHGAFAMPGISTSQVAAPAFIAAATGRKVYHEFQLAGRQVHLTDVTIGPAGALVGRRVGDIQADRGVNIVMHQGPAGVNVNPAHDVILGPHDVILVIAPMDRLIELEAHNRPAPPAKGKAPGPEPLVSARPAASPRGSAPAQPDGAGPAGAP
jgi:voltage-gated potassium channel